MADSEDEDAGKMKAGNDKLAPRDANVTSSRADDNLLATRQSSSSSQLAVPSKDAASKKPSEELPAGQSDEYIKLGSFFVKERGCACVAMFIPDGKRVTFQQLADVTEKIWRMPGPNVIVSCDAGTVHPKKFAAAPLVKTTNSFKSFWKDALLQADRMIARKEQVVQDTEREQFALNTINEVLFLRLVTIFSSILDSAVIMDNWILIDRTGSKSPAADVLVEAAMMSTTARPQIVVIDSLQRLQQFRGERRDAPLQAKTAECIRTFLAIKNGAAVLGTDDQPTTVMVQQLYDANDFMYPDNYNDLPLPRPAEPEHLKGRSDGKPNPRVRWQYHYLQTFFGSGTHYFVLDNASDAPDMSSLGKIGYVVANGQGLMAPRLKRRIHSGESIVMLHNTGGVVQAWASIRKAMLASFLPPEPSELLEKLELKSTEEWQRDFGLAEILMMLELHQRAPMLFKTSCVDVDVMHDTSEDVLNTLTLCFAGGDGIPEVGLGEAERLCLLTCWKRHKILHENAEKFGRIADNFQVCAAHTMA